jgi:hypothetical protein
VEEDRVLMAVDGFGRMLRGLLVYSYYYPNQWGLPSVSNVDCVASKVKVVMMWMRLPFGWNEVVDDDLVWTVMAEIRRWILGCCDKKKKRKKKAKKMEKKEGGVSCCYVDADM